MRYLEHHIVNHCNLNCAGCSHFSPLAQPWFESKEQFLKDFTELSKKTNGDVGTIRLMGGEPLLHPDVSWFCEQTRKLFPNTEIHIVSNGILWNQRKEELISILNKNKIVLCISDYGLNIDLNAIAKEVNHHRFDGKSQMYNIALTHRNFDKNMIFTNCDHRIMGCNYFQNGCFYVCAIAANIETFNNYFEFSEPFIVTEDDRISIYNHTIQEVEEFLKQPIELCSHCDMRHRLCCSHNFYISNKEVEEWTYQL